MRTRSSIVAVLAAASCLLLSAPSATAASGDTMVYTTDPGHPAAFGWFHPYGEAWTSTTA